MACPSLRQVGASSVLRETIGLPGSSRTVCPLPRVKIQLPSEFIGHSLSLRLSRPHASSSQGLKKKAIAMAEAVATTSSEVEVEISPATEDDVGSSVEVLQADNAPSSSSGKVRKTKGLKNIMETLHKRAIEAASEGKDLPDLRTGDIVQLRVEVPENKKRVSLLRGIVIARHNAGIHTTFRIRRIIAGVGVEMVFPLYSPNIREIKVVNKRKVRRAKLYYLRYKIARLSTVN